MQHIYLGIKSFHYRLSLLISVKPSDFFRAGILSDKRPLTFCLNSCPVVSSSSREPSAHVYFLSSSDADIGPSRAVEVVSFCTGVCIDPLLLCLVSDPKI